MATKVEGFPVERGGDERFAPYMDGSVYKFDESDVKAWGVKDIRGVEQALRGFGGRVGYAVKIRRNGTGLYAQLTKRVR